MSKVALFHNFSDEAFTGFWGGKPETFKPGKKKYMQAFLAAHYAKHLTNRELLKLGKETCTSPKVPEDVPDFWNMFQQACTMVSNDDVDADQAQADVIDRQMRADKGEPSMDVPGIPAKVASPGQEAQIVTAPDAEDEENFEGLKDGEVVNAE